jgi:hypothetical protein
MSFFPSNHPTPLHCHRFHRCVLDAAAGGHDTLNSMSMEQALNAASPIAAYFYEQSQQQQQQHAHSPAMTSPSPPPPHMYAQATRGGSPHVAQPLSHAQVQQVQAQAQVQASAAAAVHVNHQPSNGLQHHAHHHQSSGRLPPLLPQQQRQVRMQDSGAVWDRVYSPPLSSYHHQLPQQQHASNQEGYSAQQQQQQQQQQLAKSMQRAASASHIMSPEYGRGSAAYLAAAAPNAAFMLPQPRSSIGMQASCSPYTLPQHSQSTRYMTSGGLPPQSPMVKGSMITNTSHSGAPYPHPSGPMNPNNARGFSNKQYDMMIEQKIREYNDPRNNGATESSQANYPCPPASNAEAFGFAQLLGRPQAFMDSYEWPGQAYASAPAITSAGPGVDVARAHSRSSTSTPSLVGASPRFGAGAGATSPVSEHPYGAFPMFQEYAVSPVARPNELVRDHMSPAALYPQGAEAKTGSANNKTTQKRYAKQVAKAGRLTQRVSSPSTSEAITSRMGEGNDTSLFRDAPDAGSKSLDDVIPINIRVSNLPKDKRIMFERACGDIWKTSSSEASGSQHRLSPSEELRNRNLLEIFFALIGSEALANQREIPDELVRPVLERVLLPKVRVLLFFSFISMLTLVARPLLRRAAAAVQKATSVYGTGAPRDSSSVLITPKTTCASTLGPNPTFAVQTVVLDADSSSSDSMILSATKRRTAACKYSYSWYSTEFSLFYLA